MIDNRFFGTSLISSNRGSGSVQSLLSVKIITIKYDKRAEYIKVEWL